MFDSSSLIDLERRDKKITVLSGMSDRVILSQKVAEEVNAPGSGLSSWLSKNGHCVVCLVPEEDMSYREFILQVDPGIHDGEATALAIARHRHATLVSDDKAARRKAEMHGVACMTLIEFLSQALIL